MAEVVPGVNPDDYGLNTSDILSSANIEGTLTRPTAKLDDILGIRKQAEFDVGYTKSKAELKVLQEAARAYGAKTERGIQEIGDWRERAEAITGEKRSYAEQRYLGTKEYQGKEALLRQQLGEQASEVQWRVGVAEQNINFVRELKLQYPGAGIKFGDDMNKIEKRIVKFGKEQKKKAEKEAFRSALRAMGKKTKGLSRRELERKLRKANKVLYEQTMRENELRLEGLELDIQNTRSIMANRGRGSKKDVNVIERIHQLKDEGKDWGASAEQLAREGFDVSTGSAADVELRRSAGMGPVEAEEQGYAEEDYAAIASWTDYVESGGKVTSVPAEYKTAVAQSIEYEEEEESKWKFWKNW